MQLHLIFWPNLCYRYIKNKQKNERLVCSISNSDSVMHRNKMHCSWANETGMFKIEPTLKYTTPICLMLFFEFYSNWINYSNEFPLIQYIHDGQHDNNVLFWLKHLIISYLLLSKTQDMHADKCKLASGNLCEITLYSRFRVVCSTRR
jgi:hypothetical protein